MKVEIGIKPAVWTPKDGREPVTFMVARLPKDEALKVIEVIRGVGKPAVVSNEGADFCFDACVRQVRSWSGLNGDPECTEESVRDLLSQEPPAIEAIIKVAIGRVSSLGERKNGSGVGSSPSFPTPEQSAERA